MTKRGRPTTYTPELVKEICDTIASSSKGTKKLCNENSHWPSQDSLFAWLKAFPEFSEQYAQAKRIQVEVLVDEILEITDDSSQDSFINDEGKRVPNKASIERARLKIDTRKWIACKLAPRVYGKVDNTEKPISLIELMLKLSDESKIEVES